MLPNTGVYAKITSVTAKRKSKWNLEIIQNISAWLWFGIVLHFLFVDLTTALKKTKHSSFKYYENTDSLN